MSKLQEWGERHWRLILLFFLPLLITLINPNWMYNPDVLNNIDTWIYNGLFRYFFDFADKHPSNIHYFVERVSWVLPGYVLYHIFGSILANAILHLSVFYLSVFSIYAVVRRLFDKDVAFITALCLGSYTWFLRAAGHDYVDGAGIAYFSAALGFATEAVYRTRFKLFLFVSGVFLSLALLTQLFLVVFLPIIGLYYLVLNGQSNRYSLPLSIIWWAIGGIATLLGFMLFNGLTVGEIHILNDSLKFITTSLASKALIQQILADYSPTPATWLALPCLVMACSAICLWHWPRVPTPIRLTFRLILTMFILTLSVFIYFHHRSAYFHLIIYLYMSLLIPVLFLLFSTLIAIKSPVLNPQKGVLLLGIVLLPFLASITFSGLEAVLLEPTLVWFVAGLAMVGLITALLWRPEPILLVGSFALMSLMFSGHNGIAFYDRLHTYTIFTSADDILALMDAQDPEPLDFSEYVVWEDTQEFLRFSKTLRGMSQPIQGHASNWLPLEEQWKIPIFLYLPKEKILLLSENETTLANIEAEFGEIFEITLESSFSIPSVDPTGQYRGYLLSLTRIENP